VKKCLIFSFMLFACCQVAAFAEKIPVKITPSQVISTKQNEIEVGDLILFKTVNDVSIDDKIFIKKGSKVLGTVDFVHNNGWAGDSAEVRFKTFAMKNVEGQKITTNSQLVIDGNVETINTSKQAVSGALSMLLSRFLIVLRGSEVFVEPNSKVFNIFIEQ